MPITRTFLAGTTATIFSLSSILTIQSARADDLPELADAALSPVVVTPQRRAQTVDESLSSVSVIGSEQIRDEQPREVADLLRAQPGVSLTQNGAFGKNTSLYMRGTNSDQSVLLIDGVRMTSATTGGAAWEYLSPQEIDRVEVVRGPRTSMHGADAIGGVVQIFTREGEGEPRANAFTGFGRYNTYQFGAGVRGQSGDTRYAVSGNRFSTDGINVRDEAGDDTPDGMESTSFSGRLSHRLPGGEEVYGGGFRTAGESEFDSDPDGDVTEFVHQAFYSGVTVPVTSQWDSDFRLERSEDRQDSLSGSPETLSVFNTTRETGRWRNDLRIGASDWTFGLDHVEERVETSNDFAETDRSNTGAYAQGQTRIGRLRPAASVRYDYNESFPNRMTGQTALGLDVTDALQVRASYGTAYKAPSFNDLFFPEGGFFVGNPDLEPEKSESVELGARLESSDAFVDFAVFRTEVDDLIENRTQPSGVLQPTNVSEALIEGAEIERGQRVGPWQFRGAATFVKTENRETGERLTRRPQGTARLSVDRDIRDWRVGVTGLAESRRVDGDDATDAYGLINLRARYRIDDAWSIRLTVDNVFDKDYELVSSYNQPGRNAFFSVSWDPQ